MDTLFSPQTDYLTLEEAGALLRLLRAMSQLEAPFLPDDDETLARIARLSPEAWQALRWALIDQPMAPLTRTDEGLTYLPLLRLHEATRKRKAAAQKAGQASARKRRPPAAHDRSTNVQPKGAKAPMDGNPPQHHAASRSFNERSTDAPRQLPGARKETRKPQDQAALEPSDDRSTDAQRLYFLDIPLEEYLNLKKIKLFYSSKGKTVRLSAKDEVADVSTVREFLSQPSAPDLVERIVLRWNELAEKTGLPVWEALTPKRVLLLVSRLAEDPERQTLEWWDALFGIVERTPFLLGHGNWGWRVSFDWLLSSPDRLLRVREGRYGKVHAGSSVFREWRVPVGEERVELYRRRAELILGRAAGS
ncbi:MAG: DUF1376 domain-containing protein [Clostridiales bacterium]|nr:DUF1376 domain-containing protein [Clostridiales bacterium]